LSVVLIYDGECTLCLAAKSWIEKNAIPNQIEMLPCQSQIRKEKYPHITTEQCLSAIHLVLPDDRVLIGADSLPEILYYMKRWRWIERILRTKLFRKISPKIYSWIASNRQFLSCAITLK
jgi:predicted DCC family thiol-disulfide oxidoreductase YuxK